MLEWILQNKEWIFSGVGLFVISTIVTLIFKTSNKKQIQKIGDKSTGIQVGRDFKIGDNDGEK